MDDLRWRYVVLGLLVTPFVWARDRIRSWPLRGPVSGLDVGFLSDEQIDALPDE